MCKYACDNPPPSLTGRMHMLYNGVPQNLGGVLSAGFLKAHYCWSCVIKQGQCILELLLGLPINVVANNMKLRGGLRSFAAPPDWFLVVLSTHGQRRAWSMECVAQQPMCAMWGAHNAVGTHYISNYPCM